MTTKPHLISLETLPEAVVNLGPSLSPRLAAGHPWVYRGEIREIHRRAGAGEGLIPLPWSEVTAARCEVWAGRRFVGRGVLNPRSTLAVRLMTRRPDQPLNNSLVADRAREALMRRHGFLAGRDPLTSACRLIHAEGDGLPGLVVDKLGEVIVFQSLALAAEACLDAALQVLTAELAISRIIERNDAPVRSLEGLVERKGHWPPQAPLAQPDGQVTIDEDGMRFMVDTLGGQKTGYYLDQRDNRARVRRLAGALAAGRPASLADGHQAGASSSASVWRQHRVSAQPLRVLDCFSYTGGFAVAAAAGASPGGLGRLVLVDSSGPALAIADRNLCDNGADRGCVELVEANAFDWLREAARQPAERNSYDLVCLDPPPFAPRRGMLQGALRGYKELNLRAMRLVRPGGVLATFSCSHHVSREVFAGVLAEAAADAGCGFRVLAVTGQPEDHPVLLGHAEGEYLRGFFLVRTAP